MSRPRIGSAAAIIGELAVVFAGVLIALTADSWWETRQEHARLRANLEALARDMQSAEAAIDRAITRDSTTVAALEEARRILLANDPDDQALPPGFDDSSINVPPVPLGTLKLLVNSGDVRLIDDAEVRSALIEGLSVLELVLGWMNDLATDGRRVGEAIALAEDESLLAGRGWPQGAFGNPEVSTGVRLLGDRIDNIVTLLRRIRTLVEQIQAAAYDELGQSPRTGDDSAVDSLGPG